VCKLIGFVDWVQTISWERLKFCDESHIVQRELRKTRVLGLVNDRKWIADKTLHSKSASITLLVSCTSDNPIFYDYREESNTQFNHLDFVAAALAHGKLVPGDFYIVDNASVHGGRDTIEVLFSLLNAHGVHLLYLPKYSPELNPCELVFNVIKNRLRNYRDFTKPIWYEVLLSVSTITKAKVQSFFNNCLHISSIAKKMSYVQ